jgi:hypothetical protein
MRLGLVCRSGRCLECSDRFQRPSPQVSLHMNRLLAVRSALAAFLLVFPLLTKVAVAQSTVATPLLAQTGATKTAIGWLIVLLCIGLGLLVMLRPSGRKSSK